MGAWFARSTPGSSGFGAPPADPLWPVQEAAKASQARAQVGVRRAMRTQVRSRFVVVRVS